MEAELLKTLKQRRRIMRSAVNANKRILQRLSHKSHRIRRHCTALPRHNFFLDRLQELELAICFLEGKVSKKEYLDAQVNEVF